MVHVRDHYPPFATAGYQVAAVSMADPARATQFREQYRLPFEVLCNPDQSAYRAFGLTRGGAGQVLGPAVWKRGLQAFISHGVGGPEGDVWQLPGEFVIDQAGIVRLAHYGVNSADNTPAETLLAALAAAETSATAD